MNSDKSDFYDIQGSIAYPAILRHFKEQSLSSGGSTQQRYIAGYSMPNKKKGTQSNVRIIKLSEHDQSQPDLPKLEVTDPVEAERKRAEADLQRETQGISASGNMPTQVHSGANHTSSARQRANKSQKRRQPSSAASRVKRARDIFDN